MRVGTLSRASMDGVAWMAASSDCIVSSFHKKALDDDRPGEESRYVKGLREHPHTREEQVKSACQ